MSEAGKMAEGGAQGGTLYLTLSLLVERARLDARLAGHWPPDDGHLAEAMQRHADLREFSQAVDPFFADIADRERHIFSREVLLQASNGKLALVFPPCVDWSTEGKHMRACLADGLELAVTRRSFWYLHSNGALSYNLSLELDYRHDMAHFLALSVLQKAAVSCSEGTQWTLDDGRFGVRMEAGAQPFWSWVRDQFDLDGWEIFRQLGMDGAMALADGERLWSVLVQDAPEAGGNAPAGYPRFHRAAFLLKDPAFFHHLCQPEEGRNPDKLETGPLAPLPPEAKRMVYDQDCLRGIDAWHPTRLNLYFLSGFLRNILDFLRQNASEVKDGTDREYPEGDMDPDDADFLLYVNQHSVFEVVSESRSLDAGLDYLGTCPYLFLVHIMAFHNEALVRALEGKIRRLVLDLEALGLNSARLGPLRRNKTRMHEIVGKFDEHRLEIFETVEKYTHLNVFRYDTEQNFFKAIERVRGLSDRQRHWDEVLSRLESTVNDIRGKARESAEDLLNEMVFVLSVLGVLQVVYGWPELARHLALSESGGPPPAFAGLGAGVVPFVDQAVFYLTAVLMAGVVFWPLYRLYRWLTGRRRS